jgi:hypothetical protein
MVSGLGNCISIGDSLNKLHIQPMNVRFGLPKPDEH